MVVRFGTEFMVVVALQQEHRKHGVVEVVVLADEGDSLPHEVGPLRLRLAEQGVGGLGDIVGQRPLLTDVAVTDRPRQRSDPVCLTTPG